MHFVSGSCACFFYLSCFFNISELRVIYMLSKIVDESLDLDVAGDEQKRQQVTVGDLYFFNNFLRD
jgi:hypothetical protein